jgi:16S rRNA (uracil1498-N3)-methyltransferase
MPALPRLYIAESLTQGALITLDEKRAHYLLHVLRLSEGAQVALFNGRDGEWRTTIDNARKKSASVTVQELLRPQPMASDLWLCFAPLRGGKTEWVVEKAVELGVSCIRPVLTQFSVVQSLNEARLAATAAEAAEQCERLDVPVIDTLTPLAAMLDAWPQDRRLIFGDESGASPNAKEMLPALSGKKLAVLIGPEGGFSATELENLRRLPYVSGMCMGPHILRADTAAVAALSLVQSWCGDWDGKPAFRK